MPLEPGASRATVEGNIARLIREGKSREQATAIAYSIAGDEDESARVEDINGWFEIARQPISKAGVFDYLGKNLKFAPGEPTPDPDKIYTVFRSPVELARPEFLESCRLIPWVNDHPGLLGPEELNAVPAEEYGYGGVTGERIEFDKSDDTLYANVKLFSEAHRTLIEDGKEELSLGYRCRYVWKSGEYKGQKYDVMQLHLRGNHLASVDEGRMGPEVAVLDHDDVGEQKMDEELTKTLMAILDRLDKLESMERQEATGQDEDEVTVKAEDEDEAVAKAEDEDEVTVKAEDEDEDEVTVKAEDEDEVTVKAEDEDEAVAKAEDEDTATGMDMADITRRVLASASRRDKLAQRLKPFVGAFDHSAKTEQQVAAYGVKKLGLTCKKGDELATLNGYMAGAGKRAATRPTATGFDSKSTGPSWAVAAAKGTK